MVHLIPGQMVGVFVNLRAPYVMICSPFKDEVSDRLIYSFYRSNFTQRFGHDFFIIFTFNQCQKIVRSCYKVCTFYSVNLFQCRYASFIAEHTRFQNIFNAVGRGQ